MAVHQLITGLDSDHVALAAADAVGNRTGEPDIASLSELPSKLHCYEEAGTRWVFDDAHRWYPPIVHAGVRLGKCHDLRTCRPIIAGSTLAANTGFADTEFAITEPADGPPSLFDTISADTPTAMHRLDDVSTELTRQLDAIGGSTGPGRLRLLCAAESAGSLLAIEMSTDGIPWRADIHDRLLTEALGPRADGGYRPAKLEALAGTIRERLDAPALNPDSPAGLLTALTNAGIRTATTRSQELKAIEHPAIAPLLEYKKLARLAAANGWAWLDEWVSDGRFRPEYVPGGVVSGRWATSGGGALQIPKQLRPAVRADDGWKLVVADAAQLEPRVLAALSADTAMVEAGRGEDLYAGIAATGFGDRAHAKVALLGAIYGSTTGESGRLMPQLRRTFPQAVHLVEDAARTGERGGVVTTRLGRSCPPPDDDWQATQRAASAGEERRAVHAARSRGRFTRNFVVQGSAADWASCWLAELRAALREISADARLVYFLHDEVMIHAPADLAETAAGAVEEAAATATRRLFGDIPVTFPVTTAVVEAYSDAK